MAESLDQVKKKLAAFLEALGMVPLTTPKVAPPKEPPPTPPVQAEIPPAVATPVEVQDPVAVLKALIAEAAGQLPLPPGSYSIAFAKTPEGEAMFAAEIGLIPWPVSPGEGAAQAESEGAKPLPALGPVSGFAPAKSGGVLLFHIKKPKKPSINVLGVYDYEVPIPGGGLSAYKHPKQVLEHFGVKITDVPCRQIVAWALKHQEVAQTVKVFLWTSPGVAKAINLLEAAELASDKEFWS